MNAITPPSLKEYQDELKRWGQREIRWEMEMAHAVMLIGMMQLALRHPGTVKSPSAAFVHDFILGFVKQIPEDYPKIRELFMLGFDSKFDAPCPK